MAHREQTGVMEKVAQLVHQETQDLQVHRENGETEASLGQGDNQEKLGHRVHLENQAVMEILDYLVQVASQDQQDHLETQCEVDYDFTYLGSYCAGGLPICRLHI